MMFALTNTALTAVADAKLRVVQMLWFLLLVGGSLPVIARHAIVNGQNRAKHIIYATRTLAVMSL